MKKILALLVIVILFVGGCSMFGVNQGPSKQEMIEVLKSEEAIVGIENTLKNIDEKALTDSGIIKTYEIDYNSVKWNPMGSIMYNIYVNNEKEQKVMSTVHKYNGRFEFGISGMSSELSDLLEQKR